MSQKFTFLYVMRGGKSVRKSTVPSTVSLIPQWNLSNLCTFVWLKKMKNSIFWGILPWLETDSNLQHVLGDGIYLCISWQTWGGRRMCCSPVPTRKNTGKILHAAASKCGELFPMENRIQGIPASHPTGPWTLFVPVIAMRCLRQELRGIWGLAGNCTELGMGLMEMHPPGWN